METNNPYSDRYMQLSTLQLLEIIGTPDGLQPMAFEAACDELNTRTIAEQEIMQANRLLKEQYEGQELYSVSGSELGIESIGGSIILQLHESPETSDKEALDSLGKINMILSIFAVLQGFSTLFFIIFSFSSDFRGNWSIEDIVLVAQLPVLLIGLYYFKKREKLGWILIGLFLTYGLASFGFLFIVYFLQFSAIGYVVKFPGLMGIVRLALYAWMLTGVMRQPVRELYRIDTPTMISVVGGAIFSTGIMWF